MTKLLFIAFWAVKQVKAVLFWVYLWQLKEYHRKRFIDHFRTQKGKSIFLNWVFATKILFLLLICFLPSFNLFYFVLPLFIFECLRTLLSFYKKRAKLPIFTLKARAILLLSFLSLYSLAIILFFFSPNIPFFVLGLLVLDILTPLFVSFFVFLFEPITLFFQHCLLRKAERKRERFKNLIVVGITGSYGKTTTKEILAFVLSSQFRVLKTERHINAEVGIAKTILEKLKPEHQIFVAEIGAYERGKITQVCKAIKPKIGIITGINQQHMATFGSQENIIYGEGFELIDNLPDNGTAVLNWDNEYIKSNLTSQNSKVKIIKYAVKNIKEADVWAEKIKVEKEKISFWMATEKEKVFCEVNLIGAHNIYAVLAAGAVAEELGMSLSEIAEILKNIKPDLGAMQLKKGINGIDIIDASYSANPDGVISALDYLKIWERKKVIMMPCLIELGKVSKEVHKKIGKKIGKICDLAIITTKDRFKEIQKGAKEAGMKKENILFLEDPRKIFEKIKNFCKEGDVVLLEGRVPKKLIELLTKIE
ncbi:MAG: UDP-N-acetylmuramoyl-tripeptide--D-alanyl-D-alanine ligase [Candidatus Pacebacteria bacterium]|nr:UDP-N-acetylmuramoyl-tripeptide--D-alanyl-D-alanine ligase [Candidatus Paceibacterota bacterium]